ncbi:hypothetical protein CEW81_09385 [Kluyvera genomosp. 3]|uniref:Uncharacterized protein n=1 Tax=Kluyvera genomosp. 3 TaxID=2774055 RepID=A0A248KH86_9ENTR|nr:hypothetical protein CEW81_09385 [Kluyvera genomosp. 3]
MCRQRTEQRLRVALFADICRFTNLSGGACRFLLYQPFGDGLTFRFDIAQRRRVLAGQLGDFARVCCIAGLR